MEATAVLVQHLLFLVHPLFMLAVAVAVLERLLPILVRLEQAVLEVEVTEVLLLMALMGLQILVVAVEGLVF